MIQKLLNKPLLLSTRGLETINAADWVSVEAKTQLNYQIQNGIAIIPIHGLLTKRSEIISPFMTTTSYEDIFSAISDAIDDTKVEKILLDIDSPGGEVSGLFDLVDFIFDARNQKPIFSVANDYACSAAYAIASSTSRIFVNRTSCVGSIGVIATHLDVSEADKKEGLKYTTIFAGEKKNDLSPHESLSESAVNGLKSEVNRLYDIFVSTVSRNRGLSEETIRNTEAATYYGQKAITAGLADELSCNVFQNISEVSLGISKVEVKGEKMTEDMGKEVEAERSEIDFYKAEILEITKLCKLAKADNRIAEFVEQGLNADQVKEKLLASMSNSKQEIVSTFYQKEDLIESPVLAAAKARIK